MLKVEFNPKEAMKKNEADRKRPRTEDKRRKRNNIQTTNEDIGEAYHGKKMQEK